MPDLLIRVATDDDVAAAGALTAQAYTSDGLVRDGDDYVDELVDAVRRAREASLLVALAPGDGELDGEGDGDGDGRSLVGTLTIAPAGTSYAEIAEPGEVELRMLAVAPQARRRGIAEALVRAAMREAVTLRARRVVLSTLEAMTSAHRLYDRLCFTRAPGRDWHHEDVALRVYTWDVPAGPGARAESAVWPPLEVADVDGWRVGLSGGFTRRANSVLALSEPRDVRSAVREVERRYAAVGQPSVFRVCLQTQPEDLDEVLAGRGYREVAPTLVLVRDGLERIAEPFAVEGLTCTVSESPDERWLARWLDVRTAAPVDHARAAALVGGAHALYLTVADEHDREHGREHGDKHGDGNDGEHGDQHGDQHGAVAVIRAALVDEWVALSCLAVDVRARRRGLGRALTRAALTEAVARGARRAFLQVEESNEPALELYSGLGFTPAERYHYRQR